MKTLFQDLEIGAYFQLTRELPMVPFLVWKKVSEDMAVACDAEGCSLSFHDAFEVLPVQMIH